MRPGGAASATSWPLRGSTGRPVSSRRPRPGGHDDVTGGQALARGGGHAPGVHGRDLCRRSARAAAPAWPAPGPAGSTWRSPGSCTQRIPGRQRGLELVGRPRRRGGRAAGRPCAVTRAAGKRSPSSCQSSRPSTVMSRSTPGACRTPGRCPPPAPSSPPRRRRGRARSTSRPRCARKWAADAPQIPAPTTRTSANAKAAGERVRRVQHVGGGARDPGAAGDLGDHRGRARRPSVSPTSRPVKRVPMIDSCTNGVAQLAASRGRGAGPCGRSCPCRTASGRPSPGWIAVAARPSAAWAARGRLVGPDHVVAAADGVVLGMDRLGHRRHQLQARRRSAPARSRARPSGPTAAASAMA